MSIRNRVRLGLVRLDTRLGIREWLRQDKNVGEEHGPSDPFAVSELRHPRPGTVLDIGGSHGQFAREALAPSPA